MIAQQRETRCLGRIEDCPRLDRLRENTVLAIDRLLNKAREHGPSHPRVDRLLNKAREHGPSHPRVDRLLNKAREHGPSHPRVDLSLNKAREDDWAMEHCPNHPRLNGAARCQRTAL